MQALAGCRWLRAIRHSLVLLLPVVFIGAMSLLFSNFPFSVILPQASPASTQAWIALATLVGNASTGILSLCLVVLISNFLSVDAQELHAVDVSPPVVATVVSDRPMEPLEDRRIGSSA